MVGGGTAHWTGWVPRMTENEFRPNTIYGEVPGANLADWPISYQELEPYYDKVEWAFGVSGEGRRQQVRRAAQPGLSLPTATADPLQPEVLRGLRQARLQRLSHARRRPFPPLQWPAADRARAPLPNSMAIRPGPAPTC